MQKPSEIYLVFSLKLNQRKKKILLDTFTILFRQQRNKSNYGEFPNYQNQPLERAVYRVDWIIFQRCNLNHIRLRVALL